jgi:hypothetical protein
MPDVQDANGVGSNCKQYAIDARPPPVEQLPDFNCEFIAFGGNLAAMGLFSQRVNGCKKTDQPLFGVRRRILPDPKESLFRFVPGIWRNLNPVGGAFA